LNADAVVGWTCFIHSCTSIMAYYMFLKEHECILPMLWQLVFTLFAIIVDGLPQIVHSWNFIFLFTWLSQYCGDIFQLCLPTLLIETHWCWFLYQFLSLDSPSICIPSHVWWTVATTSGLLVPAVGLGCQVLLWLPLLLVGLHTATNLDGLQAITLMGSLSIACHFTCGLS
jgi:hypothetical protein